jgi:DNA-binding MurR/RpiR family transcriptional regulator
MQSISTNSETSSITATVGDVSVVERLAGLASELTPAERRLAELVVGHPDVIAFGTVADVAAAAQVGTATVTRFANHVGYGGYVELQAAVRAELIGQLRPAADRIRDESASGLEERRRQHEDVAVANVRSTLAALSADVVDAVTARLADLDADVLVLSGDASTGVASQFVADLGQLRPGVVLVSGNEVAVQRALALARPDPTVVAIDLRRYDRWVLDALDVLRAGDAWILALTDGPLSPVAEHARHCVTLAAASTGPFDSHLGTLAVLDLLVAEVARRVRDVATDRLDRLESTWRSSGALGDGASRSR